MHGQCVVETRVHVQYLDGENSNVALEAPATGDWLIIYGTQDVVQMWKDQIDNAIKARASTAVRLVKNIFLTEIGPLR